MQETRHSLPCSAPLPMIVQYPVPPASPQQAHRTGCLTGWEELQLEAAKQARRRMQEQRAEQLEAAVAQTTPPVRTCRPRLAAALQERSRKLAWAVGQGAPAWAEVAAGSSEASAPVLVEQVSERCERAAAR